MPDPADLSGKIGLPKGSAGQITFYFSLPIDDYTLREAAKVLTTPGTGSYRHFFTNYTEAPRTYGAKPGLIEAAVRSVEAQVHAPRSRESRLVRPNVYDCPLARTA